MGGGMKGTSPEQTFLRRVRDNASAMWLCVVFAHVEHLRRQEVHAIIAIAKTLDDPAVSEARYMRQTC